VGDADRLAEALAAPSGRAQVVHLADRDQLGDGGQRLLERHRRVVAVERQQIDVLGAQPLQRRIDRPQDRVGTEAEGIRVLAHLGRDHEMVALLRAAQPRADHHLAPTAGVVVGRADEIAADPDEEVDRLSGRGGVRRPSEHAAVERQWVDRHAGVADSA
jgi:hypothetical protein